MKRLLVSILTVGVVGAAAIAGTNAFFSDTETSTGNTFTAGQVDLKIDSTATYNGEVWPTGSWQSTDLTNEKFFNFSDIKPGDYGENTISLTLSSNPSWLCARVDNMQDLENICNEPELDVPDLTCNVTNGDGELAENLNFFAWMDDGDNIYEPSNQVPEVPLFSNIVGPASDVFNGVTYTLADSTFGSAMQPGTGYIGLAWCAGNLTVVGSGGNMGANTLLNCDGSALGNIAQSDSVIADMHFYVEQERNNESFDCDSVTWPPQT